MNGVVNELLTASLAISTRKSYSRAWNTFLDFCLQYLDKSEAQLPVSNATLLLFLAHLYEKGFAASTIATYNSAIGYMHKISGLNDPSSSFVVKQLLKGSEKSRQSTESRFPITQKLLHRMILELLKEQDDYYRTLFISMFLFAFYGFLRLGEFTFSSDTDHCLSIRDIEFVGEIGENVVINFKSFKHSVPSKIASIVINQQNNKTFCPIFWIKRYIEIRGSADGPLFCNPNLTHISRKQFGDKLKTIVSALGLNCKFYTTHCFRYGASTMAMSLGLSDAQIRSLGRWKSDAFLRYIRT